jgi:hypothetical protein
MYENRIPSGALNYKTQRLKKKIGASKEMVD